MSMDNRDFQSVYHPYSHLKCFQGDCPCDVQCKGQNTYEGGSMHIVMY